MTWLLKSNEFLHRRQEFEVNETKKSIIKLILLRLIFPDELKKRNSVGNEGVWMAISIIIVSGKLHSRMQWRTVIETFTITAELQFHFTELCFSLRYVARTEQRKEASFVQRPESLIRAIVFFTEKKREKRKKRENIYPNENISPSHFTKFQMGALRRRGFERANESARRERASQ